MDRIDPAHLALPHLRKPIALIAEDDAVGRIVLRKLLELHGYKVILAANGAEAVARFDECTPGIVFMDVQMPVMNGHDAARAIKQRCGERFVPLVFVTGNGDDSELVRCTEAGGDAFLVKPYSSEKLLALIHSTARISAVHQRLYNLHGRMLTEQNLAKSIFDRALMPANVHPSALKVEMIPAASFSGDLFLSAYAPDGALHVLLGDFTGHGLAAALGALPAASSFRAMCAKGFGPSAILIEINTKLRAFLPTGMFCAVAYVRVPPTLDHITVINCGLPDIWLMRAGKVTRTLPSTGLALAISADTDYGAEEVHLPVRAGDQILIMSDGVIETINAAGQFLGAAQLQHALESQIPAGMTPVTAAIAAIDRFRAGSALVDDVSLAGLDLTPALFGAVPEAISGAPTPNCASEPATQPLRTGQFATLHSAMPDGWRLELELRGDVLRATNPLPPLLSMFNELPGVAVRNPALFTILAELYNNALDHGVLGLDSSLKTLDFSAYLDERERRLAALGDSRVTLSIHCGHQGSRRTMEICVHDSGGGFDPHTLPAAAPDAAFGRGISLVRSLCKTLDYQDSGSSACAIYTWDSATAVA